MNTKFTPGPWCVAERYQDEWGNNISAIRQPEHSVEDTIAEAWGDNHDDTANARLIAAAPLGFTAAELAYLELIKLPAAIRIDLSIQTAMCHVRDFLAAALNESSEDVQDRYEAIARGGQP